MAASSLHASTRALRIRLFCEQLGLLIHGECIGDGTSLTLLNLYLKEMAKQMIADTDPHTALDLLQLLQCEYTQLAVVAGFREFACPLG